MRRGARAERGALPGARAAVLGRREGRRGCRALMQAQRQSDAAQPAPRGARLNSSDLNKSLL